MNYGTRGERMESSYKRIQQIAFAAEAARLANDSRATVEQLQREYEIALESSENHSDADYERTKSGSRNGALLFRDTAITIAPYFSIVLTIALAIPLALWLLDVE